MKGDVGGDVSEQLGVNTQGYTCMKGGTSLKDEACMRDGISFEGEQITEVEKIWEEVVGDGVGSNVDMGFVEEDKALADNSGFEVAPMTDNEAVLRKTLGGKDV